MKHIELRGLEDKNSWIEKNCDEHTHTFNVPAIAEIIYDDAGRCHIDCYDIMKCNCCNSFINAKFIDCACSSDGMLMVTDTNMCDVKYMGRPTLLFSKPHYTDDFNDVKLVNVRDRGRNASISVSL